MLRGLLEAPSDPRTGTAIFVVALVALRRRQSAGNSLPSQTKLLWLMVVVVALGVAVQALFAK